MNCEDLRSFGEWELKGQLGSGGFGEVLHWKHRSSNQEIATKRLKENNRLNDDEIVKLKQRWDQEYRWMREFKMAYIVRAVEVKDASFVAYLNAHHAWHPLPVIVMEYCNDGDLRTHLQKVENVNGLHEYEVRQVLHALRYAIEFLHNKCQIEHRDLKPDNVVIHRIDSRRCYKLTDFGFARNSSDSTILKSVVGTRHYFAPEVLDTAKYTNTVDYWSLGIIAFELMCGVLPFIPHQDMYQIFVNIKRKPRSCIAITEQPNTSKPHQYEFKEEIFAENRMSRVFLNKMVEWLRLTLDVNYKTRGTVSAVNGTILKFYTELDAILKSKILTVFCLNTVEFLSYEVTPEMTMQALINAMETDTKQRRKSSAGKASFFFIYPTGHPCVQPSTPVDIFAEQLQDTSDKLNPPVMLYLLDLLCDYDPADLYVSDIIKKCMPLCSDDTAPEWLLERFVQHTYFLLSDAQRHLEALLAGLKEYALIVEHEIFQFGTSSLLLAQILLMRGSIYQFGTMVKRAKEENEPKIPNSGEFFEKWLSTAEDFIVDIHQTDDKIGQSTQKRHSSALRRAKAQANYNLFDEWPKRDIYGLTEFRRHLQTDHKKLDKKTRLEFCQKAVYNCLEKRNEFLQSAALKDVRVVISQVQQEFTILKKIVEDAHIYLANFQRKLEEKTGDFLTSLLDLRMHDPAVGIGKQMSSLKLDAADSLQVSTLCASIDDILNVSTKELIQDALENLHLMTMDVDDVTEIPSTIEFQ